MLLWQGFIGFIDFIFTILLSAAAAVADSCLMLLLLLLTEIQSCKCS